MSLLPAKQSAIPSGVKRSSTRGMHPGVRWALGLSLCGTLLALSLPEDGRRIDASSHAVDSITSATANLASGARLAGGARPVASAALHPSLATETLEPADTDPFASGLMAAVKPAPVVPPVVTVELPPPAPQAPALNYRYLGQLQGPDGRRKVYLARTDGKEVLVEPGTSLEEGYRVEAISADEVRLVFPPSRQAASIRIPPAAEPT